MTIKEFAKSKGISTQAVYQRIKGAGLTLDTLRDAQGLTQDGLRQLEALFTAPATDGRQKALQEQIEALTAALEDMRKQRDQWQRQAEQTAAALEVAQRIADQAQQLNAAAIHQPRKGFIARLLGKS